MKARKRVLRKHSKSFEQLEDFLESEVKSFEEILNLHPLNNFTGIVKGVLVLGCIIFVPVLTIKLHSVVIVL